MILIISYTQHSGFATRGRICDELYTAQPAQPRGRVEITAALVQGTDAGDSGRGRWHIATEVELSWLCELHLLTAAQQFMTLWNTHVAAADTSTCQFEACVCVMQSTASIPNR